MSLAFTPETFPALWADTVNSGCLDDVLALYDEAAILMPTFSPHRLRGHVTLSSYFQQLLSKDGIRVMLREASVASIELSQSYHAVTGLYTFDYTLDDTPLSFPARFTFVIDLSRSSPIVHHHSSQVPRTLD